MVYLKANKSIHTATTTALLFISCICTNIQKKIIEKFIHSLAVAYILCILSQTRAIRLNHIVLCKNWSFHKHISFDITRSDLVRSTVEYMSASFIAFEPLENVFLDHRIAIERPATLTTMQPV